MIKSMTGYGRAQNTVDNMEITAEIRSVNHRYFEFSSRTPRAYGFLDDKLKKYVASRVTRGKIEVYISVNQLKTTATAVNVNLPLAQAYKDALMQLNDVLCIDSETLLKDVAKYPDVMTVSKTEDDEDAICNAVISVLEEAVNKFIEMRSAEGEKLCEDVCEKCSNIEKYVDKVETLSKESVLTYKDKLKDKILELLDDKQIEEQRLITETAIFADKIAVDEETVRLRSHIKQLMQMVSGDEAIGRKLDFLVQEMNRETNTIGSKSVSLEITQIVVEMKSEIEKIREQIQNIE